LLYSPSFKTGQKTPVSDTFRQSVLAPVLAASGRGYTWPVLARNGAQCITWGSLTRHRGQRGGGGTGRGLRVVAHTEGRL